MVSTRCLISLLAPSHPVPSPFSFLVVSGSFHLTHESGGSEGSPVSVRGDGFRVRMGSKASLRLLRRPEGQARVSEAQEPGCIDAGGAYELAADRAKGRLFGGSPPTPFWCEID